jgi:acyl transferase domain-containing protein/acetylornithine/succinyldiaminopimelate/putrescine aminotransferase/predicted amino acid dehydrogenase
VQSDPSGKSDRAGTGASAVAVRAAITGAACRFPGAANLDEFWALVKSRRHGLRQSPPGRYEALELTPEYIKSLEETGHQWGGYIDNPDLFDPLVFGVSRAEANSMDPQHRLLLEVVWEALENACEAPHLLAGSRTGVFVGLSSIDYAMYLSAFDPYGASVTPLSITGVAHSIAANRISYLLDLRGPSLAVDTACSSSSSALHMALRSLEQDECEAAIVCGANMILTPYVTKGFKRARLLAKDGVVKCFDERSDGYVRSEGAAAIIIRREDEAVARGNRIMSVIVSSALNYDGRTQGIFAPNSQRQIELIRAAHAAAGIDQTTIGLVEAHGTGTYRGDKTELDALSTVFAGERDSVAPCYVGSVKANVGHLEAVSGLAGLLKAALCLEKGEIPGQANLSRPMAAANAGDTRVILPSETTPWPRGPQPRRAGVSCLGLGGSNSHLVVEEPPAAVEPAACVDRPVHILKLSAKKPEQIPRMASALQEALARQPDLLLGDICYSANFGRADFEERAVIVARSRHDLALTLTSLAEGRPCEKIFRGRAQKGGPKVAFLLCGSAASYRGMGRELYDREPRFSAFIDEVGEALREVAGISLHDLLYGKGESDGTIIQEASSARVALFAVQYALANLLIETGVRPEVVASSGVGDIVSAVLDKRISLADGLKSALAGNPEQTLEKVKTALNGALAAGVHMVVEAGSQSSLLAEIGAARGNTPLMSCLSQGKSDCEQLAVVLSTLYTVGVNIDWQKLDAPFPRRRLALPTYCFDRARFWFTDDGLRPDAPSYPYQTESTPYQARTFARQPPAADPDPLPHISRQELFELLRHRIAEATSIPATEISECSRFDEFAIDSIAAFGLLLRLEMQLGVFPDPEMFSEEMTFGAAVDALHTFVTTAHAKSKGSLPTTVAPHELPKPSASATGPDLQRSGIHLPGDGKQCRKETGDQHTDEKSANDAGAFLEKIKERLEPTDYLNAVRPDFTAALHEMLLDVDFDTAIGDRLSGTRFGVPVRAIDMVGGFGSTLFGHNHPALVGVLREALAAHRPVFVQMANRTAAGTLAKELVSRVAGLTGRDYKTVLGSTGAEMVDAAVKHALLEWNHRLKKFSAACNGARVDVPEAASKPPVFLAIEGSYHGKTLGAYSLTWHAPGRDELSLSGPFEVVWLPRDDSALAAEIFERYQVDLATSDGPIRFSRIAGLFLEPIQGEGGIFPLSKAFAGTLRRLADAADCPIVVDEIQSGMGRAGAFTASSLIDLRGDYYLFGKSLGGGLTKTTALLIDSERYAEGYGFVHTSTFAEDDHGAFVALRALQLLDEDNIDARARHSGKYLVDRLENVKARYPGVLSEVRGCGLMAGIELAGQQDNTSPLICGLSEQGLLGVFVASYLLHRCGTRVGNTLSRPSTLRLEPSAYISSADIDHVVKSVEEVCQVIASGDAADLVRHLAQNFRRDGQTPFRLSENPIAGRKEPVCATVTAARKQVVFLGHMISSSDIGLLDESLLNLTETERESITERLADPMLIKSVPLLSSSGESLDFQLYSLPLTSRAIVSAIRNGQSAKIVERVNAAVSQFAGDGARVVGLGGLLSVITRNGLAVRNGFDGLQVTTGNTYTVALVVEAVLEAMRERKIDPANAKVGIVGAGGNIGATLVQLLSEYFPCLRLVGRNASIARVERAAIGAYDAALAEPRLHGPQLLTGLAAAIANSELYPQHQMKLSSSNGVKMNDEALSAGGRLRRAVIERYGTDPFLPVTDNIEDLSDCSVIVTASNSITPILTPSNVSSTTQIICDVSVPTDVDTRLVAERPEIAFIRGGVAKAPENNQFTLDVIELPKNHLLACMTETALLGFAGKQGFSAIGDIHASGVRDCHALGRKCGFSLGYVSLEKPFAIEID